MNQTLLAALGISSAVINTIGIVPYLRDIFKHKTKPERATWWIWLMLSVVAFSAQVAAGARWSLFMTGAQTLAVAAIAFLSVKFGYGKFHRKDFTSILITIAGVILWLFTKQPIAALLIVICLDILALWLTLTKTWKAPGTETLIAWVLAAISGFLGLLAVGKFDITELIYPFYITLGNSLMVFTIVYRRQSSHTVRKGH